MNGRDADGGTADDAAVETAGTAPDPGEPIVERPVGEAIAATATAAHARIEGTDRVSRGDRVASILVAVGPGPHSGATVDLARAVAETTDAWLDLFHVVPEDEPTPESDGSGSRGGDAPADSAGEATAGTATSDDGAATSADGAAAASSPTTGDDLLSAACDRLDGFERADRWLVEDQRAADAIIEQSPYYDLVVVGETTTGTVGRFVFGSTTETVVEEAAVPVVVVEADGPTPIVGD
ncbi:universal stress protein [Halorubrum sp. BV1]|uniref:universal stress protein n=1 Tax=Halorubrum sp. BV1 TaxID=1498500 RepID=UPI0006786A93|nr:universal stress protein [Halorubrum sp. BV1]